MAITSLPDSAERFGSVLTATGRLLCTPKVLLPNSPSRLRPQAATVPSPQSARLWSKPAAMATTVRPWSAEPEFVFTATGARRFLLVLSPSWPYLLKPQAATVPSEHNAKLWSRPAAMPTTTLPDSAETPESVLTATGTLWLFVLLSPSWPSVLSPQANTVPSEHNARLWA